MPKETCYHCGAECNKDTIVFDGKPFCCNGCKTVYEILNQNELSCYYDLDQTPGTIPTEIKGKYDYLDNEEIAEKIIEFNDGTTSVVNFYIPSIHCSSCIWVLENLDKLNNGVKASIVNFPKKEARITFKNEEISLKQVVELMTSIGYEPNINLESAEKSKLKIDRTLIYQVAIAGFAFGNIMLLSFPGYFEIDEFWLNRFKPFFHLLMFIFSIPVVIYSAKDYFISAYKGLKHNILNIDVPISLGILVLFFRSSYEIFTHTGQGYFDSLSGLVFFLLLGKVFQQKTYSFLSFERDYKSYFPIAITRIDPKDNSHHSIAVHNIEQGDRLLIRNEEIIPVDGILISGNALLDYSFVTGESLPVLKNSGDKIFAGGKQTNGAIEMEALQTVTQSYLTQLWSNDIFSKTPEKNIKSLTDKMSKYFTIIILGIAFISGAYWYFIDKNTAFNVVTAVLIIACPCALALSAPFAFGNMLRIFGKNKFYLKNTDVIENISRIDTMVFDKTGTITTNRNTDITYKGEKLSESDTGDIKSLLRSSNHPLSRILFDYLPGNANKTITDFKEILGKGLEGKIDGKLIRLGSANYLNIEDPGQMNTYIYIETDGIVRGKFIFQNAYREGLKELFGELSKDYSLAILSGDNAGEKETLEKVLPSGSEILFNQKPEDKLKYIKHLQKKEHIMMFGDGLNDAGALAQSNVGIAISENINVFSPACDGILDAGKFKDLPKFIKLSRQTINIIKVSFLLSFAYNIIGMYFAVSGNLSPVIAAILMPISSISVVTFVTLMTNFFAGKLLH